jgi:hypothetical protein
MNEKTKINLIMQNDKIYLKITTENVLQYITITKEELLNLKEQIEKLSKTV